MANIQKASILQSSVFIGSSLLLMKTFIKFSLKGIQGYINLVCVLN